MTQDDQVNIKPLMKQQAFGKHPDSHHTLKRTCHKTKQVTIKRNNLHYSTVYKIII